MRVFRTRIRLTSKPKGVESQFCARSMRHINVSLWCKYESSNYSSTKSAFFAVTAWTISTLYRPWDYISWDYYTLITTVGRPALAWPLHPINVRAKYG